MTLDVARLDLRTRRRTLFGCMLGIAAYALLIVAIYPAFEGDASLNQMTQDNPTMAALFGATGSLTSTAGWLNANLYANFVPLIALLLTVGYGAGAIAGQDEDGSLGLTATLPLTRRALLLQKTVTLMALAVAVPAVTFLCLLAGPAFDLDPDWAGALAVTATTWLLAWDLGLLALAIGAATGSRGIALGVATTVAAAAYLISSLAPAVHGVHAIRWASPFYWAVGGGQLTGAGPLWQDIAALVGLGILLNLAAMRAFERLDVH
jgi:ABC-2 type transport system permease protein